MQLRAALGPERGGTGTPEAANEAPLPPGSGLEKALHRLRAVGALPAEDGSTIADIESDLRTEMVEAAADCVADIDPETARFLLIDRRERPMPDGEYRELVELGFRGSSERLRSAVERQEQDLERLRGRLSSLPSA